MREVNTSSCEQQSELIAFLYGELSDIETQKFQRHLHGCAACDAELAAFKGVRESVMAWRNESLGGLISTTQVNMSPGTVAAQRKPSALAALREFFNLSPLWMKGAVAFASVLFCLVAGLAIARLGDKAPVAAVTTPVSNAKSEEQLKARVVQLQDELERLKNSAGPQQVAPLVVKHDADRTAVPRAPKRGNELASTDPNQKWRRPLSKTEREQLAADLRLTSAKNDGDFDLLDDRINQ